MSRNCWPSDVSYETVRPWFLKFGPSIAANVSASVVQLAERESATALAIAVGVSMELPSPMPLAPSAFMGEGVSTWPMVMGGTSAAVGHR